MGAHIGVDHLVVVRYCPENHPGRQIPVIRVLGIDVDGGREIFGQRRGRGDRITGIEGVPYAIDL